MISNDITQIRAGLVNYIGASIGAISFEGKAANQTIAAILIEEVLKLSQSEDGVCDMFILKPLFRANIFVLKQRINELSKMGAENTELLIVTKKAIEHYQEMIKAFERIVDNTNKEN